MREGWHTTTLNDACIQMNGIWKGTKEPLVPAKILRTTNFSKDCRIKLDDLAIIDVEKKKLDARRLLRGDIIVEKSGGGPKQPVGRVILFDMDDDDYSFCNFTSALRIKDPKIIDYKYLHKYLTYLYFEGETEKYQSNLVGFRNLDFKGYVGIEVPYPSLPEQQRIVDILDREFAKIDALKANAEKSLQAAKELFQATLKKELEPKEGWKKITLKDIAIVRVGPFGSSLHKNDYISGGTPLVNPIHMKDGQVVPAVDFSVNQEKLNELRSYVLKEGDVVFARRGEIGRCALITDKEDGYLCGTGSLFVRFLRKTNSKFMIALFNSPFVKEQLLSKATGATMLNINSTSVENLELDMPTDKEQESILSCINDLNKRCNTLQENYQKTLTLCDDLKQSLLRKAFNGEL